MSILVIGEASESEEETIVDRPIVYAQAVLGEAAESDDEDEENSNQPTTSPLNPRTSNNEYFHRKLVESNIAFWRNINSFIRNVVLTASKQLLNADQLLIKSQVSMQSTLSSLKVAQRNSKQLRDRTEDVLTANFIPAINI